MRVVVKVEINDKLVGYYEHELAGPHAPEVAGKIHELVKKYGARKRPKRILTPEEFREAYENKELIENYEVKPKKKRKQECTSEEWHDMACDCKDPDCPDRP